MTFACLRAGEGRYFASVVLEEENLAVSIASLISQTYTERFELVGHATCKAAPPTAVELALACVLVVHSPLGTFPSFTRWLLAFAKASLPANARAELTVTGVNGGQPVSGAIDSATGKVELQGGISSFGPKQVQKLAVAGQDVTQQLVAKVGSAPTVTSSQGLIVGTCP